MLVPERVDRMYVPTATASTTKNKADPGETAPAVGWRRLHLVFSSLLMAVFLMFFIEFSFSSTFANNVYAFIFIFKVRCFQRGAWCILSTGFSFAFCYSVLWRELDVVFCSCFDTEYALNTFLRPIRRRNNMKIPWKSNAMRRQVTSNWTQESLLTRHLTQLVCHDQFNLYTF